MDYGLIKTLHILSATLLFGTGLGTAYFMWSANRTRDARITAAVARHVVRADWIFTLPTVIFQPISGIWLVQAAGYAWTGWIGFSLALYGIAAACWLPVVWLQIRMRDMAASADERHQPLPNRYWRYARAWFWLGVPAFIAMVGVFFLMVLKSSY
jgi:uncharacterized membrane protein